MDEHEMGKVQLQFYNADGDLIVSSNDLPKTKVEPTSDIQDAISTRGAGFFVGKDSLTGKRVMAASGPIIYSNGELVGVLRYVTSTDRMNVQIIIVAIIALCVLLIVETIILF